VAKKPSAGSNDTPTKPQAKPAPEAPSKLPPEPPSRVRTTRPLRRDDPKRKRTADLELGSQQELGKKLLDVLRDEGNGVVDVVFSEGAFWEYIDPRDAKPCGLWVPIAEDHLRRILGQHDGASYIEGKSYKPLKVSDNFMRGAIACAAAYAGDASFFNRDTSPVVVFSDCAVRLTPTGVIERLDHSPDHRARAGYTFPFDLQAQAPRFFQMMQEHFEGDADAADKINTLGEFLGACLFATATRFQKCLALPSDGGGGRSTFLQIMEAAMPTGSVAHVEAKDLRSAERRARLPGKRLCFSDEVPGDAFLETEDFKKIVVGNVVTGEQKYKASFDFRPICGLVFPIQVAASAELTDAFFRRFIIVRYNRNFDTSMKRDFDLAAKIIRDELPGVVAWMIESASRLLARGRYAPPASHVDEEAKWMLTADTVRAFLDTMYTKALFKEPRDQGYDTDGKPNGQPRKVHDWTSGSKLYTAYREWCEANGHRKPVANPEFKRRIEKIGYPQAHTHKGNFYGVRLLEDAQKYVNADAREAGTPPVRLKGAVSILQGVPHLTLVKDPEG
jgi:hypothetical protein